MTISLKGYFSGFSSRSDGSASVRCTTQELTDQDFANFKKHLNCYGTITFTEETEPGESINI